MTSGKEKRTAEGGHNVVLARKYFGAPMEKNWPTCSINFQEDNALGVG